MVYDLDYPVPDRVPNPPPWSIHYFNDSNGKPDDPPIAKTTGLNRFKKPELQIRSAPPNMAAAVLDRLAIWLVYEGNNLENDSRFKFAGLEFNLVQLDGILRVAWDRDHSFA